MSTAGPNYPSTATDAGGGAFSWSNLSNAQGAPDGLFSSVNSNTGQNTNFILLVNFGFSLPSSATINGIQFDVLVKSSAGGTTDSSVRAIKSGSVTGTDQANGATLSTSLSVSTYGGSSNLLGGSWLYSDINSSTFGIKLCYVAATSTRTISLDSCACTITYTSSGTTWTATSSGGGVTITAVNVPSHVGNPSSNGGGVHLSATTAPVGGTQTATSSGGGPTLKGTPDVWVVHTPISAGSSLSVHGSTKPSANLNAYSLGGGPNLHALTLFSSTWTAISSGGGVRIVGTSVPLGSIPSLGGGPNLSGTTTPSHHATPASSGGAVHLSGSTTPVQITRISLACQCNSYTQSSNGGGPRIGGSTDPVQTPIRPSGGGCTLSGSTTPNIRTDPWGASYQAVWWLSEHSIGTTGEFVNRTRTPNLNGTGGSGNIANCPVNVSGVACLSAQEFDAQSWISIPSDGLSPSNPCTLSCWVNLDDFYRVKTIYVNPLFNFGINHLNQLVVNCQGYTVPPYQTINPVQVQGSTALIRGTWYHVAFTYVPSVSLNLYVDGVLDRAGVPPIVLVETSNSNSIGRSATGGARYSGDLMDVRLSLVARSPAWLQAEFDMTCTHLGLTTPGVEAIVG